MNIVFLAPFGYSPKATVSARMFPMASALARRNHRVTILVPPYDNPADSDRLWQDGGVQFENMHFPADVAHDVTHGVAQAASGKRMINLAWQMAMRTRQLKPEVIHVFKPVGPGALAMWFLYMLGYRHFIVDNDDWEGKGGWLDVNPYPAIQKRFMAWQERWCLRHARAVTCASETLVTRTKELTHSSRTIALLPNGPADQLREQVVNAETRRDELRAKFGWHPGPVVIYAGTVPLNHDLDIAVKAIKQAVCSYPTLRWVVVAAGDGLRSLDSDIREAGIGLHVQRCGYMPHAELVDHLVASDIAIYPYRDSNINRAKCSGKVIDYMACGKPAVVSAIGMNRNYIESGKDGLLTEPGDASAFYTALMQLLDHPTFASLMGRMAQQQVWARFGWDNRIGELERLYLDITL